MGVLASRTMAFLKWNSWPLAVLLALASSVEAAELEVRVRPANDAVRENVTNHIGDLGDRSLAELERYRRVARSQALEALQALGYYRASIETQVIAQDPPRLRIEINPGEVVRLRRVELRISGEAAAQEGFRPAFSLEQGRPLNHGEYEAAKRSILNQSSRYGYFDGEFVRQRLLIDPEQGVADVELHFDSGPRYRLGPVEFKGDIALEPSLVNRMVPFDTPQPYDAARIAELNQALQASNYFSVVRIDADPSRADGKSVPVDVELAMREPRTLGVGLGYATDVGPRVRFEWLRHWLNARGHGYGVETEIAAPRQNVAIWYHIPLDPPLTEQLRLVGGYRYEEIANDDSLSRLLSVGPELHSQRGRGWKRVLSLKAQHEEYRLGSDEGLSTLLMPGVAYSLLRSDNRVDPNHGYRLEFALSAAKKGLLSDADLVHGEASGQGLITLWDRHRFLARAQFGANVSSQYKNVPPSLRFFAGGDRSVRGYDYQSLAPTNAEGQRIGGRYQFTASGEYQYSLTDKWRLAAFVDQGNAFDSLDFPTLKTSIGLGVRWVSPIGPLRVDLARALDGGAGIRLHFSVGPEL